MLSKEFVYIKEIVVKIYFSFKFFSKTDIFNLVTGKSRTLRNIEKSMFEAINKKNI
jgi:hypothetical protein